MSLGPYPSEEQRREALFEHEYRKYVDALNSLPPLIDQDRTPQSREVILEEAARHPMFDVIELLLYKRAKLEP